MENTSPERQIPQGPWERMVGGHRGDDHPVSSLVLLSIPTGGLTTPEGWLGVPQWAALPVPAPQFSTKTLAGRRPGSTESRRAPGDHLDPTPPEGMPDPGRPQTCGLADQGQRTSLPQRSPGTHLHPRLRRTPVAQRCGAEGSSGR